MEGIVKGSTGWCICGCRAGGGGARGCIGGRFCAGGRVWTGGVSQGTRMGGRLATGSRGGSSGVGGMFAAERSYWSMH